jgi:transcriptional regulator of NAD metabolism
MGVLKKKHAHRHINFQKMGGLYMDAAQRRREILEFLKQNSQPVSASAIAARFSVSRQIIVGDIALLRAGNAQISATPRGYILMNHGGETNCLTRTIACRHSRDNLAEELYIIVDNGCGLLDVIVEHRIYGQISGQLQIFSRYDADCFLEKLKKENAMPLSDLTGGIHLHTVSCPSETAFDRVLFQLKQKEILFEK